MNSGVCKGCKKRVEHRVFVEERIISDSYGHWSFDLCESCYNIYDEYFDKEGLMGVWNRCRGNKNVQE